MRYTVLFIFVFWVVAKIIGQSHRFDHFDISNGLSQNNINGLVIDGKGNIWAGTLDGLNKFNGSEFEIFKPLSPVEGGISGNHITAMGKGLDGDIWITTRDGVLNQYQAATRQFRQFEESTFSAAGILPLGNLLQFNDSLLCFSDGSRLGILNLETEVCLAFNAPGFVQGLAVKGDSLIVYGHFGIELWKLAKDSSCLNFEVSKVIDSPCFHMRSDNRKWYAVSLKDIALLNEDFSRLETIVRFEDVDLPNISQYRINSFAVHNEAFWIAGNDLLVRIKQEVNSYVAERFSYDTQNNFSFKGYRVTHLQFDELGNLWIGTHKNGLNYFSYEKNQFLHYNWNAQFLSSADANPVRAICHRKNGDLWLGFDRNGVGIITSEGQQKYFRHYYTNNGSLKTINNVRSVYEDSNGTLWIGASGDLCVYNEKLQRIEAVNVRFSWDWPYQCYSVKELTLGTLILTSPRNVGYVNLKTGHIRTLSLNDKDEDVLHSSVRDIVMDSSGDLWIAKDNNGVFQIDNQGHKIQNIRKSSHGLSDNKVYCLKVVGDSLWIGTNAGLNVFSISQGKIVKSYFETDGLCNNIIYSLNQDRKGNLWMSTNRGISCLNPSIGHFKTYLSNDFFMDDAHCVDDQGRIFYGGYTGVVVFDPDDIKVASKRIKASLDRFRLFNKEVFKGDTVGDRVLFTKQLDETDRIRLGYDENTFSISFNAYPFDYPNRNIFRYRLSGLQKEWAYPQGANREAIYSVVPPGEYEFELQAAFNHEDYGPVKRLHIAIIPPFWQTIWFKVILLFLLAGALFAGYQVRLRQIWKRNILLKTRVEEQTKELRERNKQILEMSEKLHEADQSKLRFFTNISHDFRTPLTLILAHLDNLNHVKNKSVKTIRNNALRLLSLINQLIDLRKMDQGELRLCVSRFDLVKFVSEIANSFSVLATQKDIDLQFFSLSREIEVWLDRDKMEKIISNLLTNAIKYTQSGKSVLVSVENCDQRICLRIEDEGIGMSNDEMRHVFDRFYRSEKGQEHAAGHGIGLAIVQGLTKIQHGTISVESREGKGSRFELTFQKGRSHFEEADFRESFSGSVEGYEEKSLTIAPAMDFSRFGSQKILIVEDNIELSNFLREMLESWFDVVIAANGQEALDLMKGFVPDLIISDVMMPVMNGIEFCRKIKGDIQTSHIPFILLTARTDAETHIEGFELGVDDYIEKPFDSSVFLVRLKSLLENREKLKRHFEEQSDIASVKDGLSKKDREFIVAVNAIVERQYSDSQFNVERLSEVMGMSRSTFYRKFKDLTGVAAVDYIRKIRLQKAAMLLKRDSIPVSQVAELVGFQSVAHFRKCFKAEFGNTPGHWSK